MIFRIFFRYLTIYLKTLNSFFSVLSFWRFFFGIYLATFYHNSISMFEELFMQEFLKYSASLILSPLARFFFMVWNEVWTQQINGFKRTTLYMGFHMNNVIVWMRQSIEQYTADKKCLFSLIHTINICNYLLHNSNNNGSANWLRFFFSNQCANNI